MKIGDVVWVPFDSYNVECVITGEDKRGHEHRYAHHQHYQPMLRALGLDPNMPVQKSGTAEPWQLVEDGGWTECWAWKDPDTIVLNFYSDNCNQTMYLKRGRVTIDQSVPIPLRRTK